MKKLLYFLVIIGFAGTITAQEWQLVDSGTTDNINSISFKDKHLGFYSTNTKIYKTINGGNSWSLIYQNDTVGGIGGLVISNDSLYAFTPNTSITYWLKLKSALDVLEFSADTISSFSQVPMSPKFWNNEIWSIQKINQMLADSPDVTGYVDYQYTIKGNYISASGKVGNSPQKYFYYSDDFGATWQQKQYPGMGGYFSLYTFTFYDGGDDLVAVHGNSYDEYIAKSNDKGETWTIFYDTFLASSYIHFLDKDSWLLHFISSNILYKTTDGGLTYESQDLVSDITKIYFVNDDLGFIIGKDGMLYKTVSDEDEVLSVMVSTQNDVPAEITANGGTLQLVAVIEPVEAVQTVTWSVVEGTEVAEVDENGLVTAITNGVATIRAVSTENEYIYDEIEVVVDITSGVQDNIATSVKIYPNPAKGKINIEFSDTIEIQNIRLIDMQGKEVKLFSGNFNQLDLAHIPKGLYFLSINTKQGNVSEKIIIE